jgi:cyclase
VTNVRLIGRLDIKGPNLIKGVHLEGLRIVGNPQEFAARYSREGADELIYMDTVASLYGRNNLTDIVRYTVEHVFVPFTVGGGIRSASDANKLLRSGADKVAVNTAAIERPDLIGEIARHFGSQCLVISIEARRRDTGGWEAMTNNGRERTGLDVVEWAKRAVDLGAGEVLLTSVDQEGTRKGFDIALTRAISNAVHVPVIASGGMGNTSHFIDVVKSGGADAVAMADVLHFNRCSLSAVRAEARKAGIKVRFPELNA